MQPLSLNRKPVTRTTGAVSTPTRERAMTVALSASLVSRRALTTYLLTRTSSGFPGSVWYAQSTMT